MSATADRYSTMLFELAKEQNSLEATEETLSSIRKAIADSKDFRLFLKNPLLSYEERCTVLKALFEGKMPELLFKFLNFITYKGRLSILKDIIESFDHLYLANTRQMRAYVKTALPINDQDKIFITERLKDKFKQNTIIQWNVDPSLIGGFRIFADGKLYDYSFKDQLDNFLYQSTQPV